MIYSMTGFARNDEQTRWGTLVWEVSSVNHRYLEAKFRLPESMHSLEPTLREKLRGLIQRGKVECRLIYQPADTIAPAVVVNKAMVVEINKAVNAINALLGTQQEASVAHLLAWPGVLQEQAKDENGLQHAALAAFTRVMADLVLARGREGEVMQQFVDTKLALIAVEVEKVRKRLPAVLVNQRERLLATLAQLTSELNTDRLEEEVLYCIQKMDVEEELSRLGSHVAEFKRVLTQGGVAGRRFDFLAQELNREANTLASKSMDPEMTLAAVEIKVLLEQIREQIQNVE